MPASVIPRDDVLNQLFMVFRDQGYDGASLSTLSAATGLGRSSLYHYFPGGKEDMAAAVLDRAIAWIGDHLVAAAESEEEVSERLIRIAAELDALYDGGRNPCVLGNLAVGSSGATFRDRLSAAFGLWTSALARLARDAGSTDAEAEMRAEDAVAGIQGALVLAAATGNTGALKRRLAALHHDILSQKG